MKRRTRRILLSAILALAAFTTGRESEVRAAFPGDNGRIVFWRQAATGAPPDIWSINADGTGETNLTESAATEKHPDFSSDGRQIAYVKYEGGQTSLMVMKSDGSGERAIATAPDLSANGITFPAMDVPSWSPDGERIAVGAYVLGDTSDGGFRTRGVIRIYSVADGVLLDTLSLPSAFDVTGYYGPSWRPTAVPSSFDIAVLKIQTTGVIPFQVLSRDVVRLTPTGEVNVTSTPADQVESGRVDWSPDGQKVCYRRAIGTPAIVQVDLAGNQTDLVIGGSGHSISGGTVQDLSPDGTTLIYDVSTSGNASPIWTRTPPTGTRVQLTTGSGPCWGPGTGSGFEVTLDVFEPTGEPAGGRLLVLQDFTVKLTLANSTNSRLDTFSFAGGRPLVIDDRSIGGLAVTSTPAIDPALSLDPGESAEYVFSVTTTREGVVAAHTKVTARDEHGDDVQEVHSLLFQIGNAQEVTKELARYVLLKAMDEYLFAQFRELEAQLQKRGDRLRAALTKRLDAQERLEWFGSAAEIEVSNMDVAVGFLRGLPPELIASSRPKAGFKGHSVEELDAAYDESFKDEAGKGLARYAAGYSKLAADAKRLAEEGWAAALMNVGWLNSTATAEERAQVESFWGAFVEGSTADAKSLAFQWKNDMINWQATGTYMWQALEETERDYTSVKAQVTALKNSYNFLAGVVKKETDVRASIMKLADEDPVAFQREWARQDARILNTGLPLILDTLFGAAIGKVATVGGQALKFKPKGGIALLEAAKETGYVDEFGHAVAKNTKILPSDPGAAAGLPRHTGAEVTKAEKFLQETKGATLVQSSDHGNVYSMPNLGGVPEPTLDAKASILKDLEQEYVAATGKQVKLVEVLKTSSSLRKPGGVAKLELTAAKTGKPSMIDAGMPPDALGEAVYWTSPTSPTQRPGFGKLSQARQEAAITEWENANKRYAAYTNPPANSKESHLKELIGRRGRVPLDDNPNASGIQRFIIGEFEEVVVTKGDATAKLIRVKHYEVEVVEHFLDANQLPQTRVLNRKTVIDNLATAAPQTADADAVAIGKLKGYDPSGAPIVEPLSRQEREFVMGRYVDKNVKARRSGRIPDNAEHGVTLVMEDASARAAGFLLPRYGAPFLPESIGRAYLERIAKFVKPKDSALSDAQMLEEMLTAVRKEGGFGQHAVVVTSDSRYLGEVPFATW